MKNISVILIVTLFLFSCDLEGVVQSAINKDLGLNILVKERTYRSFENKPENEMEFLVYNYEILNKDKALFKEGFPKEIDSEKDWKLVKWRKTSFYESDQRLNIARNYTYSVTGSKEEISKMFESLKQKDNVYTYSYIENNGKITDILMYVVDVDNKKFYIYEIFSH